MQQIFDAAADYFVITVIAGCFVLGMILRAVTTVMTTNSREKSRREIAATLPKVLSALNKANA